jgi:cold shock protein
MSTTYQGRVRKWILDRGFGFIVSDDGEQHFAHITAFERAGLDAPAIGTRVAYDLAEDPKSGRMRVSEIQIIVD